MAKFKNYVSKSFSDIASDTGQNLGSYKIYLNKPLALIECDWKRSYCDWWWSVNDHAYYTEKRVDYDEIWIEYDPYSGLSDPSLLSLRNAPESNPISINPVFPCSTTLGTHKTPTNPTGYVNHTTCKLYNKSQDYLSIIGIPADEESWAVTMNLDYVDNLFNSRNPKFTITEDGKNVLITMSSNYKSANFPDGEGLPRLLNPNKGELDDSTDDVISYQKSSLTYTLPWRENVSRDYRLETQVPNYKNSGSGDNPSIVFNKIDMFNDLLHINTRTAYALKASDLKINGQELQWTKHTDRQSYNIYVDGVFKETTTETSWRIPDDLYIDQKHTYSISVNDWVKTTYYWREAGGKRTPNASRTTFPAIRDTYIVIFRGQKELTSTSWTNVGVIEKPVVTMTVPKLNSRTFVVSHSIELGEAKLYYKIGEKGTLNPIINNTVTLDKMKVNTLYDLYFYASSTINGKEFFSEPTNYPVTPAPYPKPSITGLTKTAINAYNVAFSSTVKPNKYEVYLNKVIYKGNASSPINVSGWLANSTNYIKVKCIYEEDQTYNSEVEVSYGANYTPLLKAPTLTKKDIKENNVEQGFGDAGSKEIINNVITQVELSWSGIEYASGYVLYDKYKVWNNDTQSWEEGERIYPTQEPDKDTEFMQTTVYKIYMDNVMGYHDYSIKAIAAIDETYNSSISNSIHLEQNFPLNPPVIEWTNPNTYFEIDEGVPNADFYSIQLVPSKGTTHTLFRSFDPEKYPFQYSFYDMVKDLRESEYFIGSVFSRSYNAFYFHPSKDSDVKITFEVIKLDTPHTLLYEETTSVLTWTGDYRAHSYDVSIRAIDGDWKTYNVSEPRINFTEKNGSPLASNLYVVYVTARRDPDSRTLPVFLDSEKSENFTFGLINTPKNFERHVNQFSWDGVGADRYIFYEYIEATPENGLTPDSFLVIKYDENGKPYPTFKVADTGETPTHTAVSITTVDGGGTSLYLGMDKESMYRPTEGKHYYSVQAATAIENTGFSDETYEQIKEGIIYSLLTDPIEVDIKYLPTIEPEFEPGTSVANWEYYEANVVMDTRINNISEAAALEFITSYTIDKDIPGFYQFKVRAISTVDQFLYQTSEFSEPLNYSVYQLNRPEIDLNLIDSGGYDFSGTFFWKPISNATSYQFVCTDSNGNEVINIKGITPEVDENGNLNYYNAFGVGDFSAYVIAEGTSLNYPNPKYINSEISNIVKFGKLSPPEISIEENIVSWNKQENADYYEIYNYGKYFAQTDNASFILDVSKPYSYSINVISKSLSDYIIESEISNSVQYTVVQLEAPKNLRIEDDYIVWDLSLNADYYRLYMDGVELAKTSDNKYNLNEIYANKAGIVGFTVKAFSNRINYLTSEFSNSVRKNITKVRKYNITIDGKTYDEIQLPFEIHLTLDETLDDAGITIAYIDRAEPFERFSTATLTMYEGPSPSRRYDFVVMSDEVSSIQIGNEVKYKHSLILVEQTIKLQNIMVPDFTVSAPLATKVLPINAEVISYDTGGNYIPGNKWSDEFDGDVVANGQFHYVGDMPTGWLIIVGLTDNFKGTMKNVYEIGDEIILPTAAGRISGYAYSLADAVGVGIGGVAAGVGIGVGATIGGAAASGAIAGSIAGPLGTAIGAGVGLLIGGIGWLVGGAVAGTSVQYVIDKIINTDDTWPYPERNYYIRKHHPSYDKVNGYTETLIGNYKAAPDLGLVNYTFKEEGVYDIILEVPAVNLQDLADKGLIDVKFLGDLFGEINDKIKLPSDVNYMRKGSKDGEPCTFRVVWHGINVVKAVNTFKPKKLSWVLEKVMELTDNKYKIDPAILALTDSIDSPDFTFSGGKLLYDVLEEIGREFKGIPRLLKDDIITFDILDETSGNGNTLWRDQDVMYQQSQDLDNIAGGFVTRISNMIADEDLTYYPAPNRWIKSRGESNAGAVVDISNLSIVVDKPIYKLKQVLLKNCFKGNRETVVDITNYIYQEEMYNTLNNNAYGKGLALKWSQGSNTIRGLGQLPEESKFYAAIGWSSDKYVIQNIIENYLKNNMDTNSANELISQMTDPTEYVYQIKYQGYISTTSFIEDSNMNRQENHFYKVFNQESNTVSDNRFGDSALVQLKRHNGLSIKKEYLTDSFSFIPLLGQHIMVGDTPYYIDELKYTFTNALITSSVNFSKNYNKINPKVNIKSEYRQFELKVDSNVDRNLNFNNYCYIGDEFSENNNKQEIQWMNTLSNAFNMNTENKLSSFYFNCYGNNNLEKVKYLTIDEKTTLPVEETIEGISIPASYNRIATSIQYCAQMEDSFSAGRAIRYKEPGNKDNKKMVQEYVRYVGDESTDQTPLMRITLGNLPSFIGNSYEETYPKINWFEQPMVSLNDVHFSKLVNLKKDQRERLGFNYQMHFISNRNDIIIHKGLTKYLFKNNDDPKKSVRPILVAHYENLTHKEILTNYTKIKDLDFSRLSGKFDCSNSFISDKNYTGLAIIWPDTKEILLEIRKPLSKNEHLRMDDIYFNFLDKIKN